MDQLRDIVVKLPLKSWFQRVPGLWLVALLPFAVLGPVYAPAQFGIYYFILHMLFAINNCRSAYGMYVCYNNAKMYSVTDWLQKYCDETGTVDGNDTRHDLPYEHVTHIIILPNYKEDIDTLRETLDVLASHTRAVTQYRVCLAMEETEKGCEEKAQGLMNLYAESFYEITYTVHPAGRPGEIRGKSSNVAWASSQMALRTGGYGGRHEHEILTVMDADTCFAEDYFTAATYHYTVASPEQRKIMMFAPSTVFDRNSNNVPVFVRVTDMFWSIGVISNLYPSSSVKIPCSAYSVSMELAMAVNFWDAGPEAIGEDMHMYLKCFFATEGRVIVKSIFSPASQCNVEGSGTGFNGYVSYMRARYTQAKRHMWGSLDSGFVMRNLIESVLGVGTKPAIQLKNAGVGKLGKEEREPTWNFRLGTVATLLHRVLESHILMGHLFTLIITSALILPVRSSFSYALATFFWAYISDEPVHPYVEFALNASFWVRLSVIIPNVIMIWYYEKYHEWVGFERWALQEQQLRESRSLQRDLSTKRVDSAVDIASADATPAPNSLSEYISPSHAHLRVQHLGKRAQLASRRIYPRNMWDWFCIPVAGFLFYVLPQFHAQLSHIFTDSLEYKVAAKPQLAKPSAPLPTAPVSSAPVSEKYEYKQSPPRSVEYTLPLAKRPLSYVADVDVASTTSSKGDEGYFEEFVDDGATVVGTPGPGAWSSMKGDGFTSTNLMGGEFRSVAIV
ncbi:hypothetical protein HDV00_004687 [Rhizophlyctis rosea]|nr:hypothetical protein HDV00_004687 [Rhizophlyctis rosea]